MTDAVETPAACASCGHALAGESYCSRCGEEVLDARKLALRYFLTHSVLHELVNVDGKIWRTLKLLLFRPGFLAIEYAAGRRRPYVGPVRVLIVAIIAYVLAIQGGTSFSLNIGSLKLSMAPQPISPGRSIEATLEQVDRWEILERMFTDRVGPVADAVGPTDIESGGAPIVAGVVNAYEGRGALVELTQGDHRPLGHGDHELAGERQQSEPVQLFA